MSYDFGNHIVEVVEYNDDYLPELTLFCWKCRELGWKNNDSIEAMKLDDPNVHFWLIFIDGKLIGGFAGNKLYILNL